MAFSAVGVIRAKALLDKDEGLRAWRTFGADDATAGVELLRGLYGTLQMLGPLPLMAVDWRHEKSLVAVLESLMELFQSSFISDGDLIDTQKDVLRAKSQVMATALVRSRTFDAIARLVAPSGGVRFRSNEAKRSICRSLGEMLSWLFRVVQRIQQEVNDGKYAAAHAAAQAAAAAAGPSSSSSSAGSSVRGTAGAEDLHPELSPDGKRSVLAEQVVAAVQRSGILEHLAAAVLQLTVGQAPAHEDSFSPALEAIALAEPSAEAKSSNGRMQSLVLDALEFFSACNSVLLSVVSPEEEAAQRLPANPFGVCVQWYLTSHVLAQLAASELHSMMVPYRLMAAERSIAPAAAARRAVAAAGESGGPVPALTSVSEWAQAHSLPHEAAALSGLLEVTALNLELYGLDADEALPHPVVEGCGGCKEVNCAGGVPLLRVRTIINTLRSWVRTVLEPEAHAEPGPVTGKDASAPGGPNQRFHLISNRGKIALAKRVAQTALERWLDIDERTEAEKVAKLGPAGQDPAAAAGPSGGQPPQQPQTAAPAPEPKRTKPLTQKELRQQAAAAKKAQTQAPKKGGGGSGGAASASERARKETEEKQQEKIKQAWLLGGFPPQACAGLAVTSLMTAYTLHDFAAIRHVLEVHRHLEEVEQYKQLQLEGANAGAEARGGCCGGGGAGGGGNAPAATAVAYVHGVARASEGGTGAEAPPALPAGILMQYLPEPSSMLLPQSWWTGALQCLDLLARLGPGDDSVQVGAVFSELMKSVLSGASSPRFEFFRRMHSRTSLGDQCSDVRQEGDQVDTFIAAMHQASLRRGLQLGLVPALEAMARQLARTPHPGGSTVTAAVLGAASRWDYLEQLLWQAPLEEAAALIVTLAKVAAKQFSHAMSVAASAKGTWSTTGLDATKAVLAGAADLQLQASEDAIASMMGVGAPADGSGGAGAEGEAPQGQHRNIGHRAGLLSLGLASWLPAARHMLDCLDEIALAKLVTLAFTHGWTGLIASIRDLLCTALDWVPVLVQAGLLAELQGDALMAASWNAFVLRGMGPAQLMRKCATLCQLGVIVRGGPQERMVVRSAEVLAAVYPQELKQVSLPDWWQLAGSEAAAGAAATSDVLERLMCSPVTAGNVLAGSLTALLPPALVRNRAGVCANLGCGCIRGPSDRDVPLTVVCSGCRVSRYCSQHCLEQHASDYDHTPEVCALIKDAAADVARK